MSSDGGGDERRKIPAETAPRREAGPPEKAPLHSEAKSYNECAGKSAKHGPLHWWIARQKPKENSPIGGRGA